MENENGNRQRILQLCECLIPNLIGLFLDSYLGFGISLGLLLCHWLIEKKKSHQ